MKVKIEKPTAREQVLQDLLDQRDESDRMRRKSSLIWRVRSYVSKVEYWVVVFAFPIAILLWVFTGDFWKGFSVWALSVFWSMSGNFRGMSLHVENLIEWIIRKRV